MNFRFVRALISVGALFLILSISCIAQTARKGDENKADAAATPADRAAVRASPAYAEVLLLKTELESDVEALLVEYTDEYPKIKESRYQLSLIKKEMVRILAVKAAEVSKLSQALGKLLVRKIEIETELWVLRAKYSDEHPDIKRAKRKLEIFEASIKDILG